MRRPLTKSFVSHRDWLLPPPDALTRPGDPIAIVFAVLWVAPFAAIMEWRRRRRHAQRSESRANQG